MALSLVTMPQVPNSPAQPETNTRSIRHYGNVTPDVATSVSASSLQRKLSSQHVPSFTALLDAAEAGDTKLAKQAMAVLEKVVLMLNVLSSVFL